MKVSYAADSKGNVLDIHNTISILGNIGINKRLTDLQTFSNRLTMLCQMGNISADKATFDFMLQPLYTDDCALFFCKTPLDSSCDEIKLSNSLKNKPDFAFDSIEQENRLKSIFSSQEAGRTVWWLLTAEIIALEHNLYDGQYISLKQEKSIPYNKFISELKKSVIQKNDLEKNTFCQKFQYYGISQRNYFDVDSLLRTAIVHTDDVDSKIEQMLNQCNRVYDIDENSLYSNRINMCLWLINNRKPHNIFVEYSDLKLFFKRELPQTIGIHYKENAVVFTLEPYGKQAIYVCCSFTNPDNRLFVMNGHVLSGIDKVKDAIRNIKYTVPPQWYCQNVIPYIEGQKTKG